MMSPWCESAGEEAGTDGKASQLFIQVQKVDDGGQTQQPILHVGEAVFS